MTASNPQSSDHVAVTGAGGMLGHDVVAELQRRGISYRGYERAECDITEAESCRRIFAETPSPTVVINCAAYTDVNRAESEEDRAILINGTGAGNLASACAAAGARLVHVSTDYVFDGTKPAPYECDDITGPLNAYGRSKLAGEEAIQREMSPQQYAICRTSWLYGVHGPNFVKTMLNLARDNRDLKIINDQTGAPTYTVDLARALVDIALTPSAAGIFNVTNGGSCTWYEFAAAIFDESGVRPASIAPCGTDEFPTPARRPHNSRLSPNRLMHAGIEELSHWRDALRRYLHETGELASQ